MCSTVCTCTTVRTFVEDSQEAIENTQGVSTSGAKLFHLDAVPRVWLCVVSCVLYGCRTKAASKSRPPVSMRGRPHCASYRIKGFIEFQILGFTTLLIAAMSGTAYTVPSTQPQQQLSRQQKLCMASTADNEYVVDPAAREAKYRGNIAKYLVDLHDSKAVFNFCGGMLFQLSLSDRLRTHLADVAKGKGTQPVVYDATKRRMSFLPGYTKSNAADNIKIFHGREVRQVPTAAGGFGFVLQLSMAGVDDPQGWTKAEVQKVCLPQSFVLQ